MLESYRSLFWATFAVIMPLVAARTAIPRTYGILLFDDLTPLDAFGPLSYLNSLPTELDTKIYIISSSLDPVATNNLRSNLTTFVSKQGELVLPTHTLEDAPSLDVLLVPGGLGTRTMSEDAPWPAYWDFIVERTPQLQYLLSVCTGASVLARSGVLDGKNATTNKAAFTWVQTQGPSVHWIAKARWVVDGNIWTSSGVEAGIDMLHAFIGHVYGQSVAQRIADTLEYIPHTDPSYDPFSELYNLTSDANISGTLPASVRAQSSPGMFPITLDNPSTNATRNFGILLYPGFNVLDVFGVLEYIHNLSFKNHIIITTIAHSLDPVKSSGRPNDSRPWGQALVPTATLAEHAALDVLLIPGSPTIQAIQYDAELVQFVSSTYPILESILTIGTGSVLAAKAGILIGRNATTSKTLWKEVTSQPGLQDVHWIPGRWVVSGNVWTASGSAAGMDAANALLATFYGADTLNATANWMEYEPHRNSTDDPFFSVWNSA